MVRLAVAAGSAARLSSALDPVGQDWDESLKMCNTCTGFRTVFK